MKHTLQFLAMFVIVLAVGCDERQASSSGQAPATTSANGGGSVATPATSGGKGGAALIAPTATTGAGQSGEKSERTIQPPARSPAHGVTYAPGGGQPPTTLMGGVAARLLDGIFDDLDLIADSYKRQSASKCIAAAMIHAHEFDKAARAIKLVEDKEDRRRLLLDLTVKFATIGDEARAQSSLDQITDVRVTDYIALADAAWAIGRSEQAAAWLGKAKAVADLAAPTASRASAFMTLAERYARYGERTAAGKLLRLSLDLTTSAEVQMHVGFYLDQARLIVSLGQLGDLRQVMRRARQAAKSGPYRSENELWQIAELEAEAGDIVAARADAAQSSPLGDQQRKAYGAVAAAMVRAGDVPGAKQLALGLEQYRDHILGAIAEAQARSADVAGAKDTALSITDRIPTASRAGAYLRIAKVLSERGDAAGTHTTLAMAHNAAKEWDIMCEVARAQRASGDEAAARKLLVAAVDSTKQLLSDPRIAPGSRRNECYFALWTIATEQFNSGDSRGAIKTLVQADEYLDRGDHRRAEYFCLLARAAHAVGDNAAFRGAMDAARQSALSDRIRQPHDQERIVNTWLSVNDAAQAKADATGWGLAEHKHYARFLALIAERQIESGDATRAMETMAESVVDGKQIRDGDEKALALSKACAFYIRAGQLEKALTLVAALDDPWERVLTRCEAVRIAVLPDGRRQ